MLTKDRYTLPVFFGTVGMVLYVVAPAYGINLFVHVLIAFGTISLLSHGTQLIKKEYDKEKAKKIRRTIISLRALTILLSGMLNMGYEPTAGLGVGIVLAFLSTLSVKLIYK